MCAPINITNRLFQYFSVRYLIERSKYNNSRIYKALIDYGYKNFKFEVLEYCKEEILFQREQYYIDTLDPEYNILRYAGSSLGFSTQLIQ